MRHPAQQAIDLCLRWRGHAAGQYAACNVLFATFRVGSPEGRYADKFGYNNTCYTMWLDDLAWDYAGIEAPHRAAVDPSPAAAEILKHERRGTIMRKTPMTDEARSALVVFLREKVGLLGEIAQTLAQGKDRSAYGRKFLRQRQQKVSRHSAATEQLISRLGD